MPRKKHVAVSLSVNMGIETNGDNGGVRRTADDQEGRKGPDAHNCHGGRCCTGLVRCWWF